MSAPKSRHRRPAVRYSRAALVAALACTLPACTGGSDDPGTSTSTPATTSTATTSSETAGTEPGPRDSSTTDATDCTALTAEQASELAGVALATAAPRAIGPTLACQWRSSTRFVQVVDVPARTWGASLPAALEQVKASGAEAAGVNGDKLAEAERILEQSGPLTDVNACAVFSLLIEMQGESGDRIVNIVPNAQRPLGVNAQICGDGRYTSVLVADPAGLPDAQERAARVLAEAERVHALRT